VRSGDALVSIGLPVRNGERYVDEAVRSALAQGHGRLELVISDNASEDNTEEICRQFARVDARVRYYRQPQNVGLVTNFNNVLHLASGTYFKWMGDDDWLAPTYVARSMEILDADASLILVTTQQAHVDSDGAMESASYDGTLMRSGGPVDRLAEILRLVNESHLLLDPLYGMMRRARVLRVPRPIMVFEDQVFAARLALAGPFGHLPEVLSYRRSKPSGRMPAIARRLGVPPWQAKVATALQCRELLRAVREAELRPDERRRANAGIAKMFMRRQRVTAVHRSRKLAAVLEQTVARQLGGASMSPNGR
jgi:GT2 family glycosyltransferase